MEIEYVTHASLFLRQGPSTLLLDPFCFLDDIVAAWVCHFPPRSLAPEHFGRIDYAFSSHIHPDHSHPRTLAMLKQQIGQVLLPAERRALRARYEGLGFRDIRLLENGRTQRLADDLEVTSFWSDRVDSVLVVEAGGTVVLHQNDCVLDRATAERIGERFRIDYAFMCHTAAGELYPLVLERAPAELEELVRAREDDAFRSSSPASTPGGPRRSCPTPWRWRIFTPTSST